MLAESPLLGDFAAEEGMVLAVAEGHRAEPLAHAPVRDHPPGELHGMVQIAFGAGAELVEDELFRRAAAHVDQQERLQAALADVHAVFFRQEAASRPARGREE